MKKKFRIAFRILFLLFLVLGAIYILVVKPSDRVQTATGPIFGTTYHITYTYAEPIDTFIVREMQAVDHSLSMFNPQSTTSRINRGETDQTDGLVDEMWLLSERIAADTDGAFDPTVAPLVNAWGFGFKHNALPDSAGVDSLLQLVGHDKVKISHGHIAKQTPGLMLDFSAVAKGYGVDRVARLLDSRGVKHYMVEIGGEVVVKGGHPANRPSFSAIYTRPKLSSSSISLSLICLSCFIRSPASHRFAVRIFNLLHTPSIFILVDSKNHCSQYAYRDTGNKKPGIYPKLFGDRTAQQKPCRHRYRRDQIQKRTKIFPYQYSADTEICQYLI